MAEAERKILLRVEDVGKCYRSYTSSLQRFASWFGANVTPSSEHWAVQHIGFDLHAGEAIGLVGQNGAGKSTLLKLITGTVKPTTGSVDVRGTTRAILELGIGFNPEMTGRQNIYQAGGLLGLTDRRIAELIPAIEDFAELGDFFDKPLRVYSSGMHARLAFSLITAERPDILIVDEVLAVGDSYFQHKSFNRIKEFKEQGSAILLVTHGMADVRALCDRAVLIDSGRVIKDGAVDEVVDYYNALIAAKEGSDLTVEQQRHEDGWLHTRSGTGEVTVIGTQLLDRDRGEPVETAVIGRDLQLVTRVKANAAIPKLVLGHGILDKYGRLVWGNNTWYTKQVAYDISEGEIVEFRLDFPCDLGPGSYGINTALTSSQTHLDNNFEWNDNILVFDVVNAADREVFGFVDLKAQFSVRRDGTAGSQGGKQNERNPSAEENGAT